MKLIDENESRVAITTDVWTASNQRRGFMTVTAHFVDNSWTSQSRILRFIYVPSPHTKEVLRDYLVECLMDWNVDRKLSTITLDNCSTNDAMIGKVMEKLRSGNLMLSGKFIHMLCCAHILNLIVKDGLQIIKDGIEKIRDSVAYWRATPKREEKFEEFCKNVKVPYSKKLGLDCETRWNSTYLMLKTALMYKSVFIRANERDSQYKSLPIDEEWKFAKEVCDKLGVFFSITELFSGTKYPTANEYFSMICEVKIELLDWGVSCNDVIKTMAKSMLEKFEKYWNVNHGIMGVAAVLDPFDQDSEDISSSQAGLPPESGSKHMIKYLSYMNNTKRAKTSYVKTELDHYLEEECIPWHEEFDILYWWKQNGLKYPTLQAIAKDVLAIPVSTVAFESAFSTSGRLVSPHRSRLNPKTLEALMCAQNWLWASEKVKGSKATDGYATIYDDMDNGDEGLCSTYHLDS